MGYQRARVDVYAMPLSELIVGKSVNDGDGPVSLTGVGGSFWLSAICADFFVPILTTHSTPQLKVCHCVTQFEQGGTERSGGVYFYFGGKGGDYRGNRFYSGTDHHLTRKTPNKNGDRRCLTMLIVASELTNGYLTSIDI